MNIHRRFKKTWILIYFSLFIVMHNMVWAAPFGRSTQTRSVINENDQYEHLVGVTAGIGRISAENNKQGASVYANLVMLWFNFSVEYQHFDDRSATNTYTGFGLGRYLQVQYGYGNEGYIVRVRSEFEVIKKFTIFMAKERYPEKPVFDNYSFGIGYNF